MPLLRWCIRVRSSVRSCAAPPPAPLDMDKNSRTVARTPGDPRGRIGHCSPNGAAGKILRSALEHELDAVPPRIMGEEAPHALGLHLLIVLHQGARRRQALGERGVALLVGE